MKKIKIIASALALAFTVTSVCVQAYRVDAAKAKKISLQSKANVTAGKTIKLKLKNGNKKAKVTWKSSKTKIAKVTKKITKGNKPTEIKGIKKGTAKIMATYKQGKKKDRKFICTLTVNDAKQASIAQKNKKAPFEILDTYGPNMAEATVNGERVLFFKQSEDVFSDSGTRELDICYYSFTGNGEPRYALTFRFYNKLDGGRKYANDIQEASLLVGGQNLRIMKL